MVSSVARRVAPSSTTLGHFCVRTGSKVAETRADPRRRSSRSQTIVRKQGLAVCHELRSIVASVDPFCGCCLPPSWLLLLLLFRRHNQFTYKRRAGAPNELRNEC